MTGVVGIVLAAGAGRRMGRPKSLLVDLDGTAVTDIAVDRLTAAGCEAVVLVLGAEAERARALLQPRAGRAPTVVVAEDWDEGMGASLRTALATAEEVAPSSVAALVTLVDLPDVGVPVMERVLDRWRTHGAGADALVRATYDGRPGHPVLLGRDHWAPLRATLSGDHGAQGYLSRRIVQDVSCEDLATGRDVDRPEELA